MGTGEKKLLKTWQTIWSWQLDNNMEVNKKKSGIMIHKGKLKHTTSTTISGVKTYMHKKSLIPIVDSYKYLGIVIDKHLNFQEHLSYIRDKIKKP